MNSRAKLINNFCQNYRDEFDHYHMAEYVTILSEAFDEMVSRSCHTSCVFLSIVIAITW